MAAGSRVAGFRTAGQGKVAAFIFNGFDVTEYFILQTADISATARAVVAICFKAGCAAELSIERAAVVYRYAANGGDSVSSLLFVGVVANVTDGRTARAGLPCPGCTGLGALAFGRGDLEEEWAIAFSFFAIRPDTGRVLLFAFAPAADFLFIIAAVGIVAPVLAVGG